VARFVSVLLFLAFVDDSSCAYAVKAAGFGAPMGWYHQYLLDASLIKIRPFDLAMLVVLVMTANQGGRPPLVAPMKSALLLIVGAIVVWFLWGLLQGGDARYASWQTYLILSMVLLAFTVASAFRTLADFQSLAKWLVAAAIYRAAMCWLSYFTWAKDLVGESGAFLTSHDDTIGWVVSLLVLGIHAVEKRSSAVTIRNFLIGVFLMGAIQFNSRRLAWVSLGMGVTVAYLLFPQGPAKRRVTRVAKYLLPLIAVYVVVGWGRESPIFLPLRSLSSVSTREDASTLARNAENLGLVATGNATSMLMGAGWGKPYIAITWKYDISSFELWQYVPHNSILGLLAFTGALGFAGFWMAFPTGVFFNARVARLAADPKVRAAGLLGAAQLVVCANQLYGDMGIFDLKPMYSIAISYALALRLPSLAGVWNGPSAKVPKRENVG
jgi:hypothetical protein